MYSYHWQGHGKILCCCILLSALGFCLFFQENLEVSFLGVSTLNFISGEHRICFFFIEEADLVEQILFHVRDVAEDFIVPTFEPGFDRMKFEKEFLSSHLAGKLSAHQFVIFGLKSLCCSHIISNMKGVTPTLRSVVSTIRGKWSEMVRNSSEETGKEGFGKSVQPFVSDKETV